ncbi:MAG: GTPase HflX, partial [Mesorhizobium sp.]
MAREKDADHGVRGKSAHQPGTEAKGPTRAVVIVPVLARHLRSDDESNRPRLTRSAE